MSWDTAGKIVIGIFVIYFIFWLVGTIITLVMFARYGKVVKQINKNMSVFDASPSVPEPQPKPEPEKSTVSVPEDNTTSGFTNEFRK